MSKDEYQIKAVETTLRAAAILTTSYVAATVLDITGIGQVQLLCNFTKGGSDGCRLKIEFSNDGTNYWQESRMQWDGTDYVHTVMTRKIDATAALVISLPVSALYMKVSAAAITAATTTSLTLTASTDNV